MPSSTNVDFPLGERIRRLREAVQRAAPGVCPERALIWTAYHRKRANRGKPPAIRMAEALAEVLRRKRIVIHPDEIVVGNFTSRRVGGSIFPELHGLPVMLDLLKMPGRATNPLAVTRRDTLALLRTVPFWLFRFLGWKVHRRLSEKLRFIADQLRAHYYLINESGGISHFAPDYAKLLRLGCDGIVNAARRFQGDVSPGTEAWNFYQGVCIASEGLAAFGERYAALAETRAGAESDPHRRAELEEIAAVCRRVPRHPARSLREAVQSLFFAQIALNLESLDNAVCPGRMDQYLLPYYRDDIVAGRLDPEGAREILAAFSIKMSEIVPVFSEHLTNFHGGMFNGQVVTVGGQDADGGDATNALSFLFLEILDALRMRQPNFHARLHAGSPAPFRARIGAALAAGANSPALYNDEAIVPTLTAHGYSPEHARDYTGVGCVEPVSQGRSFASTDAALVNTPVALELALNQGRRFGARRRVGPETPAPAEMTSMADVRAAFEAQLGFLLGRLAADLRAVEGANRRHHPTPLTSMLLDGCLESGRCSTAGGARYNFSGIQCVGPADAGDALYAIERAVFADRRIGLPGLVAALQADLVDPRLRAYLQNLPKYGNDHEAVDRWTAYVVAAFDRLLRQQGKNTRGGSYVPGLYSVTAHTYFGRITGALPSGRRRGAPFASGIAPANGMDRLGPTALINSASRVDYSRMANGINFNLTFDRQTLRGAAGPQALTALLGTWFRKGGMQAQVNVLDPQVLLEARRHPGRHPHLLVRVSGYSAYFADLTPVMQDEIIARHRATLKPP